MDIAEHETEEYLTNQIEIALKKENQYRIMIGLLAPKLKVRVKERCAHGEFTEEWAVICYERFGLAPSTIKGYITQAKSDDPMSAFEEEQERLAEKNAKVAGAPAGFKDDEEGMSPFVKALKDADKDEVVKRSYEKALKQVRAWPNEVSHNIYLYLHAQYGERK